MLKHNHLASISAALIAAIVLLFTSCVPENPDPNADLPKGAIRLTAPGYKPMAGTKLGVDQYGAQVHFIEGDEVWINGETYTVQIAPNGSAYISDSEPGKNPISYPIHAIYPASLVTSSTTFNATNHTISGITIPSIPQTLSSLLITESTDDNILYTIKKDGDKIPVRQANVAAPLIGYQEEANSALSFKHLAAALILAIDNPTCLDITITDVALQQKNESNGGVLSALISTNISFLSPSITSVTANAYPTNKSYYAKINFDATAKFTIPAGETGYIQLPIMPVTDAQFEIAFTASHDSQNDGVAAFEYYFKRKQSYNHTTINQSEIAYIPITFNPNHNYNSNSPFQTDGLFSISATEKVYFAKGNLRYKIPSSGTNENEAYFSQPTTWSFCDNQYDVIETATTNLDNGKSPGNGTYTGLFVYGSNGATIQPRSVTSNITGDLTTSTNNFDWGIRVGDGNWFTLSASQWKYLLEDRTMKLHSGNNNSHKGKRYLQATIHGIKGLIIFPDFYWGSMEGGPDPNSADNTVSDDDWIVMQKKGAVFLPAAGYASKPASGPPALLNRLTLSGKGTSCYYWTSTDKKYMIANLSNTNINPTINSTSTTDGNYLRAVRLVRRATANANSSSR